MDGIDQSTSVSEKQDYEAGATQEDIDLEDAMLSNLSNSKTSKVDMRMIITEVEEDKYCVQFNKVDGDHLSYNKAYDFLTKDVLSFAVDDMCLTN